MCFIPDDEGMHLPQDELFKQNQKHDFDLDSDVITLDVNRGTYVSNPGAGEKSYTSLFQKQNTKYYCMFVFITK